MDVVMQTLFGEGLIEMSKSAEAWKLGLLETLTEKNNLKSIKKFY